MSSLGSESTRRVHIAFARLAPRLVLYARQWVETETAEDCVQDVFVRLMLQRKWPERLEPWLFRSVRNQAIGALRAKARQKRRAVSAASGVPNWFLGDQKGLTDVSSVQSAMAELDSETREVLVLRIWAGLSYEDIAKVTGLSMTTSFRRFREGLAQMKQSMQESRVTGVSSDRIARERIEK